MVKYILHAVFGLAALFFIPSNIKAQVKSPDEQNGFAQYKFGSSPKDYPNLEIELDENETKLYSVVNPAAVETVSYEYIRLTFTKNKLTAIAVQTKNGTGKKLVQYIKDLYGEPRIVKNSKNYEWRGKAVQLIYTGVKEEAALNFYTKI